MYKIKKIILERFIFIITLYVVFIIVANRIRTKDEFQSVLAGKVLNINQNPRNLSQISIQFENTKEINVLSNIYNNKFTKKNDIIIKGDSIYKPMFSDVFYIYRMKDSEYKLIHKLSSTN